MFWRLPITSVFCVVFWRLPITSVFCVVFWRLPITSVFCVVFWRLPITSVFCVVFWRLPITSVFCVVFWRLPITSVFCVVFCPPLFVVMSSFFYPIVFSVFPNTSWLPIWYLSTFIVFLYCLTHRFAFLYLLTICFNNVLVYAAFIKLKYYECLLCLSQSRTCLLFVCLESDGQIRFFVLLILVELLTITVQINVTEHRRGPSKMENAKKLIT